MATPLREIFVEFVANFDFEEFNKADQSVDNLKGNLKDTDKQTKKTGQASGKLSGVMGSLDGVLGRVGISTSGLTGALGAAAIAVAAVIAAVVLIVAAFVAWVAAFRKILASIYEFVSAMAEVGGQIANVSARLNIAARDLQAWRQALAEGNIEVSRLDDALTDLSERIGEATTNRASESAKVFRRLGIDLRDSAGNARDTGDIFLELADKLQETESQAERVRIANQLMGGSGRELIPILQNGREGLEAFREQLGLSQPEFDEFIENSVRLGTEQAKLNQAWEGTKQILFNLLAPAVIWVVEKLQELIVWLNNNQEVLEILKVVVITLTVAFLTLGAVLTILTGIILLNLLLALAPIIIAFGIWFAQIALVVLAIQDFYVFLQGGDSVFERFLGWLFDIPDALAEMARSFLDQDSVIGGFLDTISEAINTVASLYNSLARFAGLPEIHVDLRRSIQDVIPDPKEQDPVKREIRRQAFIERFRANAQDFFGVEDPALNAGQRGIRSLQQRAERGAGPEIPGLNLIPRPGGVDSASSEARRTASQSVTNNNNPVINTTINFDGVTDTAEIERFTRDIVQQQNRDVQEILSSE